MLFDSALNKKLLLSYCWRTRATCDLTIVRKYVTTGRTDKQRRVFRVRDNSGYRHFDRLSVTGRA
jgi:hypothetical protein